MIAANIKSLKEYTYVGKFAFPNPQDTRYFFAPSAIPLDKGEGYYQNLMVSTNFVNYGITKNISIGGGFEFLSAVVSDTPPIWFFTPKAGFKVADKIHAGGGLLVVGMGLQSITTLAYAAGTYGTSESNLTIGIGYGFSNELSDGFSDRKAMKAPVFLFSGTHRISNSISLLTENYFFYNNPTGPNYFGIHGVRFLGKKNAFDLGVLIVDSLIDYIPALPYVGYSRSF